MASCLHETWSGCQSVWLLLLQTQDDSSAFKKSMTLERSRPDVWESEPEADNTF